MEANGQDTKGKSASSLNKELFGDGLGEKANGIFNALFEKRQHRIVTSGDSRMD